MNERFRKLNIFKNHLLAVFLVLLILSIFIPIALFEDTPHKITLFYFLPIFIVTYSVLWYAFPTKLRIKLSNLDISIRYPYWIIPIIPLFVAVFHLLALGNIPIFDILNTQEYYKIAFIRQAISELPSHPINYTSSFILKAYLPFFILFLYFKKSKWIYPLSLIGIFYAICLIQKSYIIGIFIPVMIYTIYHRKVSALLYFLSISLLGILFLIAATNPNLRIWSNKKAIYDEKTLVNEELKSTSEKISGTFETIYNRVLKTSRTTSLKWLKNIPSKIPYGHGCGYRFLNPILPCQYIEYSREVYKLEYVRETKMGFNGTVTTCFFMYDYANFGISGFFISSIIISLIFISLRFLFQPHTDWMISLNGFMIFWLGETSFYTLFISGGWLLMIIFYLLHKKQISC